MERVDGKSRKPDEGYVSLGVPPGGRVGPASMSLFPVAEISTSKLSERLIVRGKVI